VLEGTLFSTKVCEGLNEIKIGDFINSKKSIEWTYVSTNLTLVKLSGFA